MEEELAQVSEVYNLISSFLVNYGFQMLGAIIILLIGLVVARKVGAFVAALLLRHNVDITLSRFISSAVRIIVLAMVVIIALGKLGIPLTPFVAAVGAVSLGAGLALQGLLSNYGAGISIILTRPFVVGDTISVKGVAGIVREVKLAATILTNEDDVVITIPNKHIVGEIIHNSASEMIVESVVDIAYDTDPEFAISTIRAACDSIPGVSGNRLPQVGIEAFGDSGITIGLRYWVKSDVQFQTRYLVNSAVFAALKQQNIEIPFPQREVRLLQEASGQH